MSLSKRIFAAFVAFIIVPLFALGIASYLVFERVTEEKYTEQTELTLKAIGRNINNMIKEANYFSDFWVTTEDSVESVEQSIGSGTVAQSEDEGEGTGRAPDSAYDELLERERLRQRVLLTYPGIRSVTLYRNDGRMVNVSFSKDTPIPREVLESSPRYSEVLRRNGMPVWIAPNEDRRLTGANNLFTQIRVLLDIDTLTAKGILVTRFQLNELSRIFSFYSSQDNRNRRFLVVAGGGEVIFDNGSAVEGMSVNNHIGEGKRLDLEGDGFHSETLVFDGQKSLVTVSDLGLERLGTSDWKLVMVTSWQYLSGDLAVVLRWMGGITAGSLMLALAFNLLFVRRTVLFIVRVVKAMRRVERGDLSTRVPVSGKDETTALARGFNSLVARVNELLEEVKQEQARKRRAELMLLQAQIKPHFLFNALESINLLAVQNEGRKVSKMVQRLANILRISIQQKEEIRIGQELEHLTSYLEIQKYRFEDLFEYELDVPEQLLQEKILKLTLQPLVENSIQHGFEGIGYMGVVRVAAREEPGGIAIYVSDNGIGFAPERLLQSAAGSGGSEDSAAVADESPDTGERRGLGFGNVADRLRIHYGPGYGLMACSAPGEGAVIRCLIPKSGGGGPSGPEGDSGR